MTSKEKKKSIIERFVNFASHTMRISKRSRRGKKKNQKISSIKDLLRNENHSSFKLWEKGEIQTCTFCDYCDGEIVADFTGQNIICHDSCRKSHDLKFAMDSDIELTSFDVIASQPSNKVPFLTKETNFDTLDAIDPRFSNSLNDLSIQGTLSTHDEITLIKCNNKDYRVDGAQLNSCLSDTETGSYTFSTVDLPTIKQYGIAIKKTPSLRQDISNYNAVSSIQRPLVRKVSNLSRDSGSNYLDLPTELRRMIEIFNDNDKGLSMELKCDQLMGKIRVFINLLRPVRMLHTARPPSMFDAYADTDSNNNTDERTLDRAYYNRESIFWLPRGATTLLNININCPTMDVITLLLSKFNIKNNPKKFALYEHSIKSKTEVEVRKLTQLQCPLKIMIDWCTKDAEYYHQNLETKRFVLQENDPGSIEWDEFSVPELASFLKILEQEQKEKCQSIIRKYDILRTEIDRRMAIKSNI